MRTSLLVWALAFVSAACAPPIAPEAPVGPRAPVFAPAQARAIVDAPDRSEADRRLDVGRRPWTATA